MQDIEDERQDFEVLILEILINTLQPFKCVVFMCDEVYYEILKDTLFKKFGIYISYFVVSTFLKLSLKIKLITTIHRRY